MFAKLFRLIVAAAFLTIPITATGQSRFSITQGQTETDTRNGVFEVTTRVRLANAVLDDYRLPTPLTFSISAPQRNTEWVEIRVRVPRVGWHGEQELTFSSRDPLDDELRTKLGALPQRHIASIVLACEAMQNPTEQRAILTGTTPASARFAESFWRSDRAQQEISRAAQRCVTAAAPFLPERLQQGRTTLRECKGVRENTPNRLRFQIQPLLARLGYYSGAIDGIYGPKTGRAIRTFEQKEWGTRRVNSCLDGEELSQLVFLDEMRRTNTLCYLRGTDIQVTDLRVLKSLGFYFGPLQGADFRAVTRAAYEAERYIRSNRVDCRLSPGERDQLRALAAPPKQGQNTSFELLGTIQPLLKDFGYDVEINGFADAATLNAIAEAERMLAELNLPVVQDGYLSAAEISAMIDLTVDDKETTGMVQAADSPSEAERLAEEVEKLRAQLDAANSTIVELRGREAEQAASGATAQAGLSALTEEAAQLRAQLDAANATIVELRDQDTSQTTAIATLEEENTGLISDTERLRAQLDAANATIVELRDAKLADYVSKATHEARVGELSRKLERLQGQLDAANTSVAELRDRIDSDYILLSLHRAALDGKDGEIGRLRDQLDAANTTIAELRQAMEQDFVPRAEADEINEKLDATLSVVAELRSRIDNEFVPLADYTDLKQRLTDQVAALNQTVVEIQATSRTHKRRWLEVQALYTNFLEECKATPECARTMRLVE